MKADERHLKEFKLIREDRKKTKNAKPKLYEGDRVVARESVYTQKPSHTHTNALPHRRSYTQMPLGSFTHRLLYAQALLHTGPFTHKCFYTQMPLHTDAFAHR